MRLKKVNNRFLEIKSDGRFWDSQITPELTAYILSLKDGERIYIKTKNVALCIVREGKNFFIESEENDGQFGVLCRDFILWKSDLEKVAGSLRRKSAEETLHTAVNSPLYEKYRSSVRALKRALRRAKQRSCYLSGFENIRGITSLSAERFLRQRGFRISPDGELLHPKGRRNSYEKLSQYKSDKLLEEFGLL